MKDYWEIDMVGRTSSERIGYPTQKPESLIERIIIGCAPKDGIVADFFCGGGTTPAIAQKLGRRWMACDQSRVATAITADRLTRQIEEQTGSLFAVPDFTIENWGVYEAKRLSETPSDQFRAFILKCFGARSEEHDIGVHGWKEKVPVWVGLPEQDKAVTAAEVRIFANAIRQTLQYQQTKLRDAVMLAWAFRPDAQEAAERLRKLEQTDLNFIRLDLLRIDSRSFREQVSNLSTKHADYNDFLTFVQSPKIEVGYKRVKPLTYDFDVSDTVVLNSRSKIINVQWDFDYDERFSSTPGYSFARDGKKEPVLRAQYEFPSAGKCRIACRVQDDKGGEGLWTTEITAS